MWVQGILCWVQSVLCFFGFHKFPSYPTKDIFFNPDSDISDTFACIVIKNKCLECKFEHNISTKIFKNSEFKDFDLAKREEIVLKYFDEIPAYRILKSYGLDF